MRERRRDAHQKFSSDRNWFLKCPCKIERGYLNIFRFFSLLRFNGRTKILYFLRVINVWIGFFSKNSFFSSLLLAERSYLKWQSFLLNFYSLLRLRRNTAMLNKDKVIFRIFHIERKQERKYKTFYVDWNSIEIIKVKHDWINVKFFATRMREILNYFDQLSFHFLHFTHFKTFSRKFSKPFRIPLKQSYQKSLHGFRNQQEIKECVLCNMKFS